MYLNKRRPGRSYGFSIGQSLLIATLVWLLSTAYPAWAAAEAVTAIETSPSTPTQLDAADIPADQVNQFVDVYLQVVALVDERSEELKRAATESESLQIQQSIQGEAYELIEAAGLTRQTYWQLLGLANSDAEFRDRILAQLEEKG